MKGPSTTSLDQASQLPIENDTILESIARASTNRRDDLDIETASTHHHGLGRILSQRSKVASEVDDIPPDGGYGWVVVICVFFTNACLWGLNASYGVFLAHYLANDTFPGATPLMYAFIGGLSISCTLVVAPLVTMVVRLTSVRVGMLIGLVLESGGFIAASFSTKIWQLFLTQGVLFGIGLGFLFTSTVGIVSQWFDKKRSVANGLVTAGSGIGGLAYSLGVRAMLGNLSLAWAFRITAIIAFVINLISAILIRDRNSHIKPNLRAFDLKLLRQYQVILLLVWGIFSMLGYIVILFSLPDYARAQGFSASQGSVLSALLNLGMAFGRPLVGLASDRWGRINIGGIMTLITGLSCFIIWMPAGQNYGVAILFSLVNGAVCGTFWTTVAPVTVEVVGIKDLPSTLSLVWMSLVIPSTFSEPIALYLRRPDSSNVYLFPQLWSALVYIVAAIALYFLRAWKLGEMDKKLMVTSGDTGADEEKTGVVERDTVTGWEGVKAKWERGSKWWRYAYV